MARDSRRIPIWVECGVPAHLVEAGPSYLRALRGRVTHVLRRLLPGFAQHFVVLASPYDGLPAEHRGTPAPETTPPASVPALSAAGAGQPARPRPLDIVGLPHATAVKHLYLVGRENLPGLGLEGELISGWGAARLVSSGTGAQAPVAAADPDQRMRDRGASCQRRWRHGRRHRTSGDTLRP